MHIVVVRREPGVAFSMDVYADNLVRKLKLLRPNWKITEIAPEAWGKQENLWRSGTGLRKYYERMWRHPRAVQRLEADIFHIIDHSNAHVAYWLKHKRAGIIVTCHDLVQFVYPEILKDQSRFPALSLASWKYSVRGMVVADRVITVSENTAKDVTQMLNIEPQQVTAIPNGVDSQFRPLSSEQVEQVRQKYGRSAEAIVLLNVGSTHQRKNILSVLRVLSILRAQNLPVYLWRVGDDFTPAQKSFIQAQQLEPFILSLGKPNQNQLIALYNAADVLLAPSLYEGFGLTVLEAMACGTPVITANVSSLPEVTGDAAILVDPMDVEAMAAAVCRLKTDPTYRAALTEQELARAKLFTWQQAAEKLALVYEQLAQQKTLSTAD